MLTTLLSKTIGGMANTPDDAEKEGCPNKCARAGGRPLNNDPWDPNDIAGHKVSKCVSDTTVGPVEANTRIKGTNVRQRAIKPLRGSRHSLLIGSRHPFQMVVLVLMTCTASLSKSTVQPASTRGDMPIRDLFARPGKYVFCTLLHLSVSL